MNTADYKCTTCGAVYELTTKEHIDGGVKRVCDRLVHYGDECGICCGTLQRIWTAVPILYGRKGTW
jgi:hypothetical protein